MTQPPQQTPFTDKKSAKAQAKAEKAYRKANRPFYRKPWFILLAVVAVIVIIAISTSGGDDPVVGSANGGSSGSSQSAGPTFSGQQDDDTSAAAGDPVTADGVVLTSSALVKGEPFADEAVLCTTVTIKNGSDDSISFNEFDWSLQDPDGASRTTTLGGSDDLLDSGDLAAGGTVTGDVCFESAKKPSGTYVVLYAPTFSFSSDRIAWVNDL